MACAHGLHGLTLAAIWSAPESPKLFAANRVAGIPELRGDAAVARIFQHANLLAAFDFPADFSRELKLVATVVDRPGTIGLHPDAVIGACDQLIRCTGTRLEADIGHANDGQAIPALRAH